MESYQNRARKHLKSMNSTARNMYELSSNMTEIIGHPPTKEGPSEGPLIYITTVSFCVLVAEFLTFVAVGKCKRTGPMIRVLSMNFLGSDIFLLLLNAVFYGYKLLGIRYFFLEFRLTHTFATGVLLLVSWASVTILSADRTRALRSPIHYRTELPSKIKIIIIMSLIWLTSLVLCFSGFVWYRLTCESWTECTESWRLRSVFEPRQQSIITYFLVIYKTTNIVSYVRLVTSINEFQKRKQELLTSKTRQTMVYSRVVLYVALSDIVLSLPVIINNVIIIMDGDRLSRNFLKVIPEYFASGSLSLNSVVCVYFYVWKLPECRNMVTEMIAGNKCMLRVKKLYFCKDDTRDERSGESTSWSTVTK